MYAKTAEKNFSGIDINFTYVLLNAPVYLIDIRQRAAVFRSRWEASRWYPATYNVMNIHISFEPQALWPDL